MATQGRIAITPVKTLNGLDLATESFPEAATQTYKNGALVLLSSGYITECAADPAVVMGVADRPGQNLATAGLKKTQVYLALPNTLFKGNLDNASGTYTSLATDIGKSYGLAKHAGTGKWYVDQTDTTAKRVTIFGVWDGVQDGIQAGVGDIMAHVYFTFAQAYYQGAIVT